MPVPNETKSKSKRADSVDSMARLVEMKSIQPYSNKEEYIRAMKQDLAEWFNSIYSLPVSLPTSGGHFNELNALNFIDELENGVLICMHANCIMKAAMSKSYVFNKEDLKRAGVINTSRLRLNTAEHDDDDSTDLIKRLILTSNGKTSKFGDFYGEFLLYKAPASPKSFMARDNIISFIKWCRQIVKVRECLMFEADDLMLRKNENHFILCLLEVARFGAEFGIELPALFRLRKEDYKEMTQLKPDSEREEKYYVCTLSTNEFKAKQTAREPKQIVNVVVANKVNEVPENTAEMLDHSIQIPLDIVSRKSVDDEPSMISCLDNTTLRLEDNDVFVEISELKARKKRVANTVKLEFKLDCILSDLTLNKLDYEEKLKVGRFFSKLLPEDLV